MNVEGQSRKNGENIIVRLGNVINVTSTLVISKEQPDDVMIMSNSICFQPVNSKFTILFHRFFFPLPVGGSDRACTKGSIQAKVFPDINRDGSAGMAVNTCQTYPYFDFDDNPGVSSCVPVTFTKTTRITCPYIIISDAMHRCISIT